MTDRRLEAFAGPAAVLAALTAVVLLVRPLVPVDETRYVGVAWEMWLRGEYLVMFRNGEPYSHKPPLLFWLYNLGWAVFGVNEWWPRLVSPLFSLGALRLALSIARRLWPDAARTHRDTGWILGTSLAWLFFSTAAMFDAMLAFFVLVGMRGLLVAADGAPGRGFAWLALAIGFGVLAKGPVVLLHLLPAAVLAPWWRPGAGRARWYAGILLALAGGAAIALAWAVPAALRGGQDYRDALFWGQTAHRVVDSFAHRRPVWWYLPVLPVLLAPWLVWPGLWARVVRVGREGLDPGLRFCVAWMAPVFVAFSLVSGKQYHYLVPLVPAFALFAARLLSRGEPGSIRLPVLLAVLVGGVLAHAAWFGLPRSVIGPGELPLWPALALVAIALAALRLGRAPRLRVPALGGLAAALLALVQLQIAPVLARSHDVHPMARAIRGLQQQGTVVANVGRYQGQFHFAGRLEQPLAEVAAADLPGWLRAHPQGAVVRYVRRGQTPPEVLFAQPYRGETAVLQSAAQARGDPSLSASTRDAGE